MYVDHAYESHQMQTLARYVHFDDDDDDDDDDENGPVWVPVSKNVDPKAQFELPYRKT